MRNVVPSVGMMSSTVLRRKTMELDVAQIQNPVWKLVRRTWR